MQEEAMALSDDEISDEVIMIDSNQTVSGKSTYVRNAEAQKRNNESVDDQLKAVGLYEEGLSAEQKEELLAVIAASEKSAKQEQSMREKAKEWQKKIFSDEVGYNQLVPSVSSGSQTSLQPAYVNVVNESEVESSMQMLNIEGSSESSLTDLPSSTVKVPVKKEQETACKLRGSATSDSIATSSKQVPQTSKNVTVLSESEEPEVVEAFTFAHSSQGKDDVDIQIELKRQRKELERLLAEWRPSNIPESSLITRDEQKDEKVPYSCDKESCGQQILSAIEKLHIDISQQQRTSIDFIQWGYPITVGRAYSTRSSTRIRGPDSETSDGVYNFNFPMPEQSAQTNSSKNNSYRRLGEFGKKCQVARKANVTNSVKIDSSEKKKTSDSIKVINAKLSKDVKCESVTNPESECKEVVEIGEKSSDKVSSGLTQSTSSVLCETSQSVESDIYVCDSETELQQKDSHKKSLSETDFHTLKNGPISNAFNDTSVTDSVENCDSPIIIVDDDPIVEQENVCMSEKTLRRKRMSSKVPVSSPSKRIHL